MRAQGFEISYDRNAKRLIVNAPYNQVMEDNPPTMEAIITKLQEINTAAKIIVISESREYFYSDQEAEMLLEIANLVEEIKRQNLLSVKNIMKGNYCEYYLPNAYEKISSIIRSIKYDPVLAYRRIVRECRMIRHKLRKIRENLPIEELESGGDKNACRVCFDNYFHKTLIPLRKMFEETKMIKRAKEIRVKGRQIYRKIFRPSTRPTFMYTRLDTSYPENAVLVERYKIGDATVSIFKIEGRTDCLYHLSSGEFNLDFSSYELLEKARQYIGAHEPSETELSEPHLFRSNMYTLAIDLIRDLVQEENNREEIGAEMEPNIQEETAEPYEHAKRVSALQSTQRTYARLSEKEISNLAEILARYTAGIGILETLLADEKLQDVLINAPIGNLPIFIRHADFGDCTTNIFPSISDAEGWETRFRIISGRPLDEANPVLDTEIEVKGGRARVAAITKPLSPDGTAFALRRFRSKPWTFPLFINSKMIDPFSAGLLWFIIDGARTMLVAGTRSSGKTSFLSSCMIQIMPNIRIISVEDTLELPVTSMRNIGFNIERLKSRSVITKLETELPAEEALRTALRLGDSALIVGEVRSLEAKALYEAMRIGALANVVAGTIHGESAYGVFDRVVNDLGVPPTSFKATDIIVIASTLRSPDGLRTFRRITEITEIRKHWKTDPMQEGGFVPLLEYNSTEDKLKPTQTLLTGESEVLNNIAARVKEWNLNWQAVWDNINLRARILASIAEEGKRRPEMLEAEYIVKSNSMFHTISDDVLRSFGELNSNEIYRRWSFWTKDQLVKA